MTLYWNVLAIAGLNTIALLFLCYFVSTNIIISKKKTTFFLIAIILSIICNILEAVSCTVEQLGEAYRILNMISIIFGFSISPFICISLSVLFEERAYNDLVFLCIPLLLNAVLFILNPITGWMFTLTENNEYSRGILYFFYIITYVYSIFVLLYYNYYQSKRLLKREKFFLVILFLFLFIGTTIQIVFAQIHTSWPTITFCLVIYYIFLREVQTRYDSLTNVLNRNTFELTIKRTRLTNNTYIIFFDIDKFKSINDQYGHVTGDKYLKSSADAIKVSFDSIGQCYRIGGDEFCIIGHKTNEQAINNAIENLNKIIKNQQDIDPITPSISYGYEQCKNSDLDFTEFLNNADKRMYKNKANIK